VRIKNYGAYVRKPKMELNIWMICLVQPFIYRMQMARLGKIMYRIGNGQILPYEGPVKVKDDAIIKAFATKEGKYIPSDTAELKVTGLSLKSNQPVLSKTGAFI
jgi:hypothetical protein